MTRVVQFISNSSYSHTFHLKCKTRLVSGKKKGIKKVKKPQQHTYSLNHRQARTSHYG